MKKILLILVILSYILPLCSKYGPYTPLSEHHTVSLFGILHTELPKNNFKIEEFFVFENTEKPLFYAINFFSYAFTDKFTMYSSLPLVSRKPNTPHGKKTGLGSMSLQSNYLLYLHEDKDIDFRYRIIGTAGLGLPTTTVSQTTLFSLKSVNSLIGILQDAMTRDWYYYFDFGTVLISKKGKRKTGNFILYDFGLGKTFIYDDHYITLFGEFLGIYQQADHINGSIDLATGGNAVYVGPTLRYYHRHCYVHAGILATVAFPARIPEKPSSFVTGFNAGFYF